MWPKPGHSDWLWDGHTAKLGQSESFCVLFFVFFGQNYRKNLPLATGFADLVTTMNTGGRCLREIRSPRDNAWVLHVGELRSISWVLVKGTEAAILWSPDAKNWLIGKDSDAGNDAFISSHSLQPRRPRLNSDLSQTPWSSTGHHLLSPLSTLPWGTCDHTSG